MPKYEFADVSMVVKYKLWCVAAKLPRQLYSVCTSTWLATGDYLAMVGDCVWLHSLSEHCCQHFLRYFHGLCNVAYCLQMWQEICKQDWV